MTDREVMQQALEALEGWENCDKWVWPETALEQSKRNTTESLAALRAALEQQAEPPPEWPLIKNILAVFGLDAISFVAKWQAAQRPWQGLTDDEITELDMEISGRTMDECVQAIEDKLKEKNDH